MKKLFIILIAFSLFSCEEKDPIKEKVISEVKSRMKNPDSFEFVSYEIFRKQRFVYCTLDKKTSYYFYLNCIYIVSRFKGLNLFN